jgi:hypothetical protein
VNAQHSDVLQSNDRFMKELRKKFEEERKVLIDLQAKATKVPAKAL